MRNQVSKVHADIDALEKELKETKVLGENWPRTAKRVEAVETVIARMKNSVKYVNRISRGCFNWFVENFSMILGCFGMTRGVRNYSTGENIRSPLIVNRMIGSIEMAAHAERSEKKSFLEWLNHQELDQSDEEWESELTRLKDRVIRMGIRLSLLLLDFVFLESERGDNMEIFEVFREPRIDEDYENFVVLERVFEVLETVEKELKNLKKKGKGHLKEETNIDLSIQRKPFSHSLAENFCQQILSLHMLLSKELVTKSVLVKRMEEGFREVEAELDKIEQDIGTLRVLVMSSVQEDSENVKFLKSQLELTVRESWSGLWLDQREA